MLESAHFLLVVSNQLGRARLRLGIGFYRMSFCAGGVFTHNTKIISQFSRIERARMRLAPFGSRFLKEKNKTREFLSKNTASAFNREPACIGLYSVWSAVMDMY